MSEQQIRLLLAAKLREYRERANLTAKEVGSIIGKSEKTISAWEHGRGQPDADMLFTLCNLYGIMDINVFYGLESVNATPSPTTDENELVTIYRALNPTGQNLLLTTARALSGNPDMQKEDCGAAAM